jgi:hypothetical protein
MRGAAGMAAKHGKKECSDSMNKEERNLTTTEVRALALAQLKWWKPWGIVTLGISAFLGVVFLFYFQHMSTATGAPALALSAAITTFGLGLPGLGIWALIKGRWAAGSIVLVLAGILYLPSIVGILEIIASVRIWAAAEKLWSRKVVAEDRRGRP